MNTQTYTVNIRTGVVNITRVDVSQGDTGRTLAFSLYDGLIPFTPPNGSTVKIVGRKPSGLGFSETCTVSGNVATVTTTLAMTQEAGKFPVELRIEANGESIGTANFTMYIEPSPHPEGTTDGTHATVDNLQTQIGNLANLATTAKTNLVSAINEAAQSGGVVIDDTLTQTGQAADAKKTGDEISAIKANLRQCIGYNLCDSMNPVTTTHQGITYTWTDDGSCTVNGIATGTSFCNLFISQNSLPTGIEAGDILLIKHTSANIHLYIYDYSGGTIKVLKNVTSDTALKIPETCTGLIVRLWIASGTEIHNEVVHPVIFDSCDKGFMVNIGTTATVFSDADDIDTDSFVFVSKLSDNTSAILNVPYAACWLETNVTNSNIVMQRVYPLEGDKRPIMFRSKLSGTWSKWIAVGNKGYIEAIDTASADETGKTDMTSAIMYALNTYGHCKLGEGVYYVSGHIDMPDGTTLEGIGAKTEIRLLSGGNKYAIKLSKYSTIQNLSLIGNYTDLAESDFTETSGTRYGIFYRKGGDHSYTTACAFCTISNVFIRNFSGSAIYQYDSGQNVEQGLFVSNVHIKNCWCGVHVHSLSEFCRYVNVQITYCYIACINNGGNNSFDNCVFHAYNTGFLMDNSDGTRTNNAHGMCSNSSFCHTGNNSGSGIKINTIVHGFIFTACQVWYNSVDITDSSGIVFNGVEFGRGITQKGANINISGGATIVFVGCMFVNDINFPPVIAVSDNEKVKFSNCFGSISGNEVTS